ncbi:MAG: amidophosphoribosyltransferase [Kiritimatiellaeota bacterium]|nr:amidophosphoribosyltransferase [Kiritimatiellota bacterium]
MGGFFGVVSKQDCVTDLFYGTDYHSHLGTRRGGLATCNGAGIVRFIHDITNAQFRSKFEHDIDRLSGQLGIGVISDTEDQPLIIGSHLGDYAIVTVGVIKNMEELTRRAYAQGSIHFSEMSGGGINATELVAMLINQAATLAAGLRHAQEVIEGSCSILLLTPQGLYAARDRLGRTPIESCAFPNLDYEVDRYLGPGEIVRLTAEGVELLAAPGPQMRICAFLWVYYGYPASSYEGINVEHCRYRCGAALARRDHVKPDLVAGIPDSGTGHALGYAHAARLPLARPFVKYTPTWPRSFMPQDQTVRDLVARMKLIPIRELIKGRKLLFCEDSIVRGTQLKDTVRRLFDAGACEVHMRPACPPLLFGCKFLNFSRSRSELDLAGRRAVKQLEGDDRKDLELYKNPDTPQYAAMLEVIRQELGLTTLQYQRLDDLVEAIGLPREKLCTYCWSGEE